MQRGSKLRRGAQNSKECKQYSSSPHLAKPAAKRATSRGANSKKHMAAKMRPKRARTQRYTAAPRGTVRGKPAHATGAFPTLAPALVRRRPRRTSRRAKRPSPQPSRRRRGTTLLNSLREPAHVKKPPRTKNNCSSTCWSGGDGLGSPAMITNEARAARTSSPARRRRRFAGAKRGPWSRNLPTRPVR